MSRDEATSKSLITYDPIMYHKFEGEVCITGTDSQNVNTWDKRSVKCVIAPRILWHFVCKSELRYRKPSAVRIEIPFVVQYRTGMFAAKAHMKSGVHRARSLLSKLHYRTRNRRLSHLRS